MLKYHSKTPYAWRYIYIYKVDTIDMKTMHFPHWHIPHCAHGPHLAQNVYTHPLCSKHTPHTYIFQTALHWHRSEAEAFLVFYKLSLVNWLSCCRPVYHLSPELGHQMKIDSRKLWNVPNAEPWDLHTLKIGTHFNSPRNAGLCFNYPPWILSSLWLLGVVQLCGRAVVHSAHCPGMWAVVHLNSSPTAAKGKVLSAGNLSENTEKL